MYIIYDCNSPTAMITYNQQLWFHTTSTRAHSKYVNSLKSKLSIYFNIFLIVHDKSLNVTAYLKQKLVSIIICNHSLAKL